MQSLDIISVNIWQMLISLANLVLLFLLLKKFLYKPVKKVLAQRQAAIDEKYAAAQAAQDNAEQNEAAWEEKMRSAQQEANDRIERATALADRRGEQIVADAQEKADRLLRQAEDEIIREREKAEESVRREIVDVSALLAEKMLGREIQTADHRALIDEFIEHVDEPQ